MAKIANVALTNTFDTWRVRSNEAFDRLSQFAIDNSKLYANTLTANVSFVSRGNAAFAGSTSNTLVRITQTGSGNALLVEDSANPDSTPFVVAADGRVFVGATTGYSGIFNQAFFQAHSVGGNGVLDALRYSADAFGPDIGLVKSRSATTGTQAIISSGDALGTIRFGGSDGVAFIQAASISAAVDGTPGTNDMPGRLVFSTTADGASSPTERMRIDSAGDVGIGTTNPTARLNVVDATSQDAVRITQTGSGNALVVEDSANPDSTPFVVTASGDVGIGTSLPTTGLTIVRDGSTQFNFVRNSGDTAPPYFASLKRRGTEASKVIVNNGDQSLAIQAFGYDGSTDRPLAEIGVFVDGVPGSGDMPGRLVFSTTADGASTPTERMRISANGNIGIGTSSPGEELHVNSSGAEFAIQWDSTGSKSWVLGSASNRAYIRNKTDSVEVITILNAGNVGIGTNSPAATLDVVGTVSVARANILSQTLTDGATINWNTASGQVATVTLGGNRAIAAPTNLKVGTYILHVIQDATGSRTLTWNSVFKWTAGVAPPLTTTANARDVFSFVSDGTNLYGSFIPDVR